MKKGKETRSKTVQFSQLKLHDISFCSLSDCFSDRDTDDDPDLDPGVEGRFWNLKDSNSYPCLDSESDNDFQTPYANHFLKSPKTERSTKAKRSKTRKKPTRDHPLAAHDHKPFKIKVPRKVKSKVTGLVNGKVAAIKSVLFSCKKTELISIIFALRNELTNNTDLPGTDNVFKVEPVPDRPPLNLFESVSESSVSDDCDHHIAHVYDRYGLFDDESSDNNNEIREKTDLSTRELVKEFIDQVVVL